MSLPRTLITVDAAAQRFWRAIIDPSVDSRTRCGRVSATVYAIGSVVGTLALPVLPADVHVGWLLALLMGAVVSTAVLAALPWHRLPGWSGLAPVVVALLIDGIGIGRLGHALPYFLAYNVLSFLIVGLTQPPGRSAMLAPLALASGLLGLTSAHHDSAVALVITLVVAVVVGELLSQHTRAQKVAVRALDDVLATIGDLTACQNSREAADRIAAGFAQLLDADGVIVALTVSSAEGESSTPVAHGAYACPNAVIGEPLPRMPGMSAHPQGAPFQAPPELSHGWPRTITTAVRFELPAHDGAVVGVVYASWERVTAVLDPAVAHGAEMLRREAGKLLSQLRHAEELTRQAETDPLTGLANRRVFFRELNRLAEGDAVVIIDLDHFKHLNDTLGHDAGDRELASFAATLTRQLRSGDCAARYGGEEFALVVRGDGRRGAPAMLQRVRVEWTRMSRVTLSAGVGVHTATTTPQATLAIADRALYAAKQGGRDRVCFAGEVPEELDVAAGHVPTHRSTAGRGGQDGPVLTPEQSAHARRFLERICNEGGLAIALQPVVRLPDCVVVGVEALTRFPSSPLPLNVEQWFRTAASLGMSAELELAAARAALRLFDHLPDPVTLSLNVSPPVLRDPRLRRLLRDSGAPFERIILEITEQEQVEDYAVIVEAVGPLRAAGVRLAVDDAGAGYASFRHILLLQPDFIKLDRGIISGVDHDPGQRALTTALVSFAGEVGARVVAEGVEQPTELAVLSRLGVAGAQGYHLARPSVDPTEWRRWLDTPMPAAVG